MSQTTQVRDQALHTIVAAIAVSAVLHAGPAGGAIAGLICGLIREVTESGTPVEFGKVKAQLTQTDAPFDLAFWTLGGLIAGLLA